MKNLMRLKNTSPYFFFILLGFSLTLPAFYQGMIATDDIFVYSNWHRCFSKQFLAGELYPRWLIDMNGGRGSSVFFFYPPLSFYVSALFELYLPNDSPGWFALYLSFGLSLGISGVTSFLLLNNYTQRKTAFLLALFYMLAPYHLFVDFYHRFAYPEFWAFSWVPLVFYFLQGVSEGKRKHHVGLAVAYALVLLTHIPTFIILTPLLLIYPLIAGANIRQATNILYSLFCGFLLSSFYTIPMLFYKKHISLDNMWAGKYSLFENFLMSSGGFNNDYLLKITIINFLILSCLLFAVEKPLRRKILFWFITGYFSIFLMFEVSSFIWQTIPLIHKIQFPWRLNLITLVSIIVLSAAAFSPEKKAPSKIKALFKIMVAAALFTQILTVFLQILPLEKAKLTRGQMTIVAHETSVNLGVIEYIPHWVSDKIYTRMQQRSLQAADSKFSLSETGNLTITKWGPRRIEISTSSDSDFVATIRQFYFPYWQASLNNTEGLIDVSPGQDGLIQLNIPSGKHEISIQLIKGPPEIAGIWVSFLTFLAILSPAFFRLITTRDA